MKRSTAEFIVMVLAVALAVSFVVAVIGVVVVEIDNPAQDTTQASQVLGGIFTAFAGVVIGYVLGRRGNNGG